MGNAAFFMFYELVLRSSTPAQLTHQCSPDAILVACFLLSKLTWLAIIGLTQHTSAVADGQKGPQQFSWTSNNNSPIQKRCSVLHTIVKYNDALRAKVHDTQLFIDSLFFLDCSLVKCFIPFPISDTLFWAVAFSWMKSTKIYWRCSHKSK